jgi:hypothetical protein
MMRSAVFLALALAAGGANAQTMLDQEQRLIELHSLLLVPSAMTAPGSYRFHELKVGVEVIGIPPIDGQTGGRRQITASDRTPAFPRLRLAFGLPAPEDFRAYVGVGYIPPIQIASVSSHFGSLEAELAWAPGPLSVGLRGYGLISRSQSPVTDPTTRDTLDNWELGANLAAGYQFRLDWLGVTPYAGVSVTGVAGDFTVTSDGYVLTSRTVNPGLNAGVRLFAKRFEAAVELVAFPGRLIHPTFSLAYVPEW